MKVCDVCEVFGVQSSEEFVESAYSFVFPVEVGSHEVYVVRHVLEQRFDEWFAQHGDVDFGILHGKLAHDGHGHGYVSKCGKTYDEYVGRVFQFREGKVRGGGSEKQGGGVPV